MATALKFGPADHNRPVTGEELDVASWEPGFRYEVICGRLYVSPLANLPHDQMLEWLHDRFRAYRDHHRDVADYISSHARVPIQGHDDLTVPEPDLAVYQDFPFADDPATLSWEDVSPFLVVEIVSASDADKDYVRNVELYRQVPSIREYWILDPRNDARQPSMTIYRRRGRGWRAPLELAGGEVYETKRLPGFSLTLDIRR